MRSRHQVTFVLLALAFGGGSAPAAAQDSGSIPATVERYRIDAIHSYVGFVARHMLVSRVRGQFAEFGGEILLDTAQVERSSATFTAQVQSIDTENERRDAHLRSADFFEAEAHPTLMFQSTSIERDEDQLILVGQLTMRGVSKEVRIPFELSGPIEANGSERLGIEAELEVDRFDWGLSWDQAIETGGLVVSREITIELSIAAVLQG